MGERKSVGDVMVLKLKAPTIHAIRILKYMGEKGTEAPASSDICRDVKITQSYFMSISRGLRRARLLETAQGRRGGFYLNRSLAQITLYDVIIAMHDEDELPEGLEEDPIGRVIGELNNYLIRNLQQITLESI